MKISKKQIAIFYIEKDKGTLFGASENPLVVSFPHSAINNLELVDKSKLEELITNFITENELKPNNIFIILNKGVLFEKEIKDVPLSLQTAETEKFLDIVPFHHVLTKTYNFSNKTIIVAANRDFCTTLVDVFKENSFPVVGVLPLSIIEEKLPDVKEKFAEAITLQKIVNLKKFTLPLELEQEVKALTYELPSFKNMKFVGLVSLFTFLLAILGIQLYTQFMTPAKKPQPMIQNEVKTTEPSPSATPSATLYPTKNPTYK